MFRVPLGTKCRIYGNYEKILNLYFIFFSILKSSPQQYHLIRN